MHTMNARGLPRQPDDPGHAPGCCPTCGCRCHRDPEAEALKLIRRNKGRVEPAVIARALHWSLARLERFAKKQRPPLDLSYTPPKEPEPRGA